MLAVFTGKITSLDTSTMRAAMKPGWEDLVRRCIQKFHAQHEGESLSYAKRHHHEGKRLQRTVFLDLVLLNCCFPAGAFSKAVVPEAHLAVVGLATLCARCACVTVPRRPCLRRKISQESPRTGAWAEGHGLGHDNSTEQMKGKGKRSLSLTLKTSRCLRQ